MTNQEVDKPTTDGKVALIASRGITVLSSIFLSIGGFAVLICLFIATAFFEGRVDEGGAIVIFATPAIFAAGIGTMLIAGLLRLVGAAIRPTKKAK